jgi:hypothetical protein
MFERGSRLTFKEASTWILLALMIILPLELVLAGTFADVTALRELHPAIRELQEGQVVRGVGPSDVRTYETFRLVLDLVEVALLPAMAKVAAALLGQLAAGRVPSIPVALRHPQRTRLLGALRTRPLPILAGTLVAVAVGLLLRYLGNTVIDLGSGVPSWWILGSLDAVVRSAAAPFIFVMWAEAARSEEGEERRAANLY